jgi:DNA-binding transcriptional ArsR family regulator
MTDRWAAYRYRDMGRIVKDGPFIASLAALIGDPARANILTELLDGRALTVTELTEASGVTIQTASGHLAKMTEAKLLQVEKQGRHRYYRLSGPDVAQVLETLMGLAQRTGAVRTRTGPNDIALREARICYDHLAGNYGVSILEGMIRNGWVSSQERPELTSKGLVSLAALGMPMRGIVTGSRPLCLRCLDWSERRHHLGGALGAALLSAMIEREWLKRGDGRVLIPTPSGRQEIQAAFLGG